MRCLHCEGLYMSLPATQRSTQCTLHSIAGHRFAGSVRLRFFACLPQRLQHRSQHCCCITCPASLQVRNLQNEITKKCAPPCATTDAVFYAGTGLLLCRSEDKVRKRACHVQVALKYWVTVHRVLVCSRAPLQFLMFCCMLTLLEALRLQHTARTCNPCTAACPHCYVPHCCVQCADWHTESAVLYNHLARFLVHLVPCR
jgi:hypothetical protein